MRKGFLPLALLLSIGFPPATGQDHPFPIDLSGADIEAAIDFGRSGFPAPYPLRWQLGEREFTEGAHAVYTPFVRVALWAAQQPRDVALLPTDVPPELYRPIVMVTVRHERSIEFDFRPDSPRFVRAAVVPPSDNPRVVPSTVRAGAREALWATSDKALIRAIDPVRAAQVVAAAGFAPTDLQQGWIVVVEVGLYDFRSERVLHATSAGTVDMTTWR